MTETPKQAARRLAARAIADGFKPDGLHTYNDADGRPVQWRVRLKHPDGRKHIRPMHVNGNGYELGEPPAPETGRVLYRLPELLAANGTVYVVEGERCADTLHKLGLVATTSGSSSSADGADWTPLQGRDVVLWPDNDAPGAKYAAVVAKHLHALGSTIRMIATEVTEALPTHGDVVDWLEQHPDATAADIAALPCRDTGDAPDYPEPEQLRRPLPPAAPYPLAALGDVLGGAAQAIHEHAQAPAGMCGASIVAAASLAAQGQADVINDGRREPLTLWAVTIGQSGERKSGVYEPALGAHYKHEKQALAEYQADLLEYHTELAAYEAARQKAKTAGKGNRAAIREALQAVGEPPEPPLQPILILGEPTLEGTQKQLIRGWPSIGLFSDDAGEFLGGYSMSKENKTRTAASLSKLWDKGAFDRVRAKADETAGKHYGKRCALHFMLQPVIAETVLSDDVLAGQGFLPRCLLAWPDSTIGSREHTPGNLNDNPAIRRYWAKIHALLDKPYPLADGTHNELDLPALELSPDARALWIRVYNAVEHKQADNGEYAPIRAWGSKAASQVLRMAGVLTLVDNPDAQVIEAPDVERAAELVLWHLSEALRIVGTATVPHEVKDAEKLRDWCHETGRRLLHSREALQYGPGSIRTKVNFDAAIAALEGAGWALPIDGGAVIDGKRRRRVWQIVRADA